VALLALVRRGRPARQHDRLARRADLGPRALRRSEAQRSRARRRLAPSLVDGAITISASERRSQLRNREAAMERLADLVAAAIEPPPPPRRPTKPSRGSQQRRLDAKKRRGDTKRLRRPPPD
jgi:ribosome-associated protein